LLLLLFVADITWPDEISPEAHDFIDKCLSIDPKNRLGSRGGAAEVKKHPFFSGIEWDNLLSQDYAVFVPQLESAEDLSYFDSERQVSFGSVAIEQHQLEKHPSALSTIKATPAKLEECPDSPSNDSDDQAKSLEKPIPVPGTPLSAKVRNGVERVSSNESGSGDSSGSMNECFPMSLDSPKSKAHLKSPKAQAHQGEDIPPLQIRYEERPSKSPSHVRKPRDSHRVPVVKPVVPQSSPTFLVATGPRERSRSPGAPNEDKNPDISPEPTPRGLNTFFSRQQHPKIPTVDQSSLQELDPDIFRNFSYQNLMNLQSLTLEQQKEKKQPESPSSQPGSPLFK